MKSCRICKRRYEGYSALSRTDNRTEICPICGVKEALILANVNEDVQTSILLEVIYTKLLKMHKNNFKFC